MIFLKRHTFTFALAVLFCILPLKAHPQELNDTCTVSVLNRTSQVNSDGSWMIANVPSGFGLVRARATCVENGITRSGESDLFTVTAGVDNGIVPFQLGTATSIPTNISITSPQTVLAMVEASAQLNVTASYADGIQKNVTNEEKGTTYTNSNPAVVSVSPDGLVTALSSGTVIISATNEGALGLIQIRVALTGDTDTDGIPDDVELANGLDPNNPVDAMEDNDHDGLTIKQELIDFGTNPSLADTDGDSIADGEEATAGTDGFITNPLLPDTDGDGVRDALEIATGSDPTNPASRNLVGALSSLQVSPPSFVLTYNTIVGEAFRQLSVSGSLLDGTTIDLTSSATGTSYASSDLAVCNFGVPDGRAFAGANGACTITVTNSGLSASSLGTVVTFSPTPISFISIPASGFANSVDVSGNYAFIAAGAIGLVVVNVSAPGSPQIVATLDTPGNANDIEISGNTAFIADGTAGLRIIDITNPLAPVTRGSIDTPGTAQDVAIKDNLAFVADGATGLRIIDIANLAAPVLVGSIDTPGTAKGVDVASDRNLAAVADGTAGLKLIDISNMTAPVIVGTAFTAGMNCEEVILSGNYAFVADLGVSFTTINIATPSSPQILASTPSSTGGLLMDLAGAGSFVLGADIFFVNGVPIIDVTNPASPVPRAILDFGAFRDDNGTGIAVANGFVYLTAARTITENGTSEDTRLYIGQYLSQAIEDTAGQRPSATITFPASGQTFLEGTPINVNASASDDVGVAAVHFLVNGQVLFTDTVAPYQYNFSIPLGTITLGAIAVDYAGNNSTTAIISVNVVADEPPQISLTNPISDTTVIEDTVLHVTASAADELGVSSVDFIVDNVVRFIDTTAPYEFQFLAPSGQPAAVLSARATDVKGKIGNSQQVTVNIIPDSKTTVIGRVVDRSGNPITGGKLYCMGRTALSGFDGSFSIPNLSTVQGNIICHASYVPAPRKPLTGDSISVPPVPAGTTNVSDIVVTRDVMSLYPTPKLVPPGFSETLSIVDLDKDGNLDILASIDPTDFDESIVIYLGYGDGTFQKQKLFPTGISPEGIGIADLNLDGREDIVCSGQGISVLVALGDGTFQPYQIFSETIDTTAIATDDMNNDGKRDVITANSSTGSVSIFLSNGNGTLQAERRFAASASNKVVSVADLNGDGNKDIVTTGAVLLGNGDGTLQPKRNIPIGPYLPKDLNQDGKLDLIGSDSENVIVLIGDGTGNFTLSQSIPNGSFQPAPNSLGDFNNDQKSDLVVSSFNGIFLLLGNGNGTMQNSVFYPISEMPFSAAASDLNADGVSDVVVTDRLSDDIPMLFGLGNGQLITQSSVLVGSCPNDVHWADLNHDASADLLTVNCDEDTVSVLLGNGNGTFSTQVKYPVGDEGFQLELNDLNGDGNLDIVTANFRSDDISVLLGNGNGTFQPQQRFAAIDGPNRIAIGDINGDSIKDIVAASFNVPEAAVLLGTGLGGFQSAQNISLSSRTYSAKLGDLDNDGKLDLILTPFSPEGISVMLGNGNGTFQSPQHYPMLSAWGIDVGDLNSDGKLDVVSSALFDEKVGVFLGNGDGTLRTVQTYKSGLWPRNLIVLDMNQDGFPDIVTPNEGTYDVSLFLGKGDGTFRDQQRFGAGDGPYAVTAVDINSDGLIDLISANTYASDISILLQQ